MIATKSLRPLAALALALVSAGALAAETLKVIVPTAPGGGTDGFFRVLAHEAEPLLGNSWRRLVLLADRYKIPMMQEWRDAVLAGGLISYATSLRWVYRQTGSYTGQILNGARPIDLPVVAPTRFELVINLGIAKTLGLTIPPHLLARADEVIE